MLGEEPIYPSNFGAAGKIVERSVALTEGYDIVGVVDDRQQIAEAPDAGLIDGHGGGATLLPEPTKGAGVGQIAVGCGSVPVGDRRPGVDNVVEAVTFGAAKDTVDFASSYPDTALCASELMCRNFHGFF